MDIVQICIILLLIALNVQVFLAMRKPKKRTMVKKVWTGQTAVEYKQSVQASKERVPRVVHMTDEHERKAMSGIDGEAW